MKLPFRSKPAKPTRSPQTGNRAAVFSYYNNRPADTKQAIAKRRWSKPNLLNAKRHLIALPTYLAVALIAACIVYNLFLDTTPRIIIGHTATSNNLVRSQTTYQQSIGQLLRHSIFNRSKLTINTNHIANQIEAQFPEIQTATVSLPLVGHHPIIGLDPASPALIVKSHNGDFIVDQTGRALIKTSSVSRLDQIHLPTVQDDSGIPIEQGKGALPQQYVDFITTIIQQLSLKNVKVTSLELPAAVNALQVKIDGAVYYIKFDLSGDPRLQTGTFLAVKDKLAADHVTPAEYIDVRVDERAYYK